MFCTKVDLCISNSLFKHQLLLEMNIEVKLFCNLSFNSYITLTGNKFSSSELIILSLYILKPVRSMGEFKFISNMQLSLIFYDVLFHVKGTLKNGSLVFSYWFCDSSWVFLFHYIYSFFLTKLLLWGDRY